MLWYSTDCVNACIGVKQILDLGDLDSFHRKSNMNYFTMPIFLDKAKKDLKIWAQLLLPLKLQICGVAELIKIQALYERLYSY